MLKGLGVHQHTIRIVLGHLVGNHDTAYFLAVAVVRILHVVVFLLDHAWLLYVALDLIGLVGLPLSSHCSLCIRKVRCNIMQYLLLHLYLLLD